MRTKLLLTVLLIVLLSGCANVDPTKIDQVPTTVLKYVQQPDSLVKDTILSTDYQGGYDFVVTNKKVVRVYNTDYHTIMLITSLSMCMITAWVVWIIGSILRLCATVNSKNS